MSSKEERSLFEQRSLCLAGYRWYKRIGIEPTMTAIWEAIDEEHIMWLFKQPEYNDLRKEITIRWVMENDLDIFHWKKLLEILTTNKDYHWVLVKIIKQYGNRFKEII